MKILFTADLHGGPQHYEAMFDLALKESVKAILIGGDLLPTRIEKPIQLIMGRFDFNRTLTCQYRFIDEYMVEAFKGFVERSPDAKIFYIPGNHDWAASIEYLKKKIPYAICLHNRIETLDDMVLAGYGCVTDSEFWVKDFVRTDVEMEEIYTKGRYICLSNKNGITCNKDSDYLRSRPSIKEELTRLSIENPSKAIFIFHCPPFNTHLDALFNYKPIGSKAIKKFIEDNAPLISLHGHIHESPYMSKMFYQRIGDTIAINPGQNSHRFHAVMFDSISPEKTLRHTVFGTDSPIRQGLLRPKINRYKAALIAGVVKTILSR